MRFIVFDKNGEKRISFEDYHKKIIESYKKTAEAEVIEEDSQRVIFYYALDGIIEVKSDKGLAELVLSVGGENNVEELIKIAKQENYQLQFI